MAVRSNGASALGNGTVVSALSAGWPPLVYEKLEHFHVEHGRVCFGVVLDQQGHVHQAYAHNPNHVEETVPDRIHTLIASKGWGVLAHELTTREILERVAHGAQGQPDDELPYIR